MNWTEMTPEERNKLIAEKVFSADHEDLGEFDPLHNIKDAWQVAEQFEEITISRHAPKRYHVQLWYHNKSCRATAATAPEAICMAALMAHGVEIE